MTITNSISFQTLKSLDLNNDNKITKNEAEFLKELGKFSSGGATAEELKSAIEKLNPDERLAGVAVVNFLAGDNITFSQEGKNINFQFKPGTQPDSKISLNMDKLSSPDGIKISDVSKLATDVLDGDTKIEGVNKEVSDIFLGDTKHAAGSVFDPSGFNFPMIKSDKKEEPAPKPDEPSVKLEPPVYAGLQDALGSVSTVPTDVEKNPGLKKVLDELGKEHPGKEVFSAVGINLPKREGKTLFERHNISPKEVEHFVKTGELSESMYNLYAKATQPPSKMWGEEQLDFQEALLFAQFVYKVSEKRLNLERKELNGIAEQIKNDKSIPESDKAKLLEDVKTNLKSVDDRLNSAFNKAYLPVLSSGKKNQASWIAQVKKEAYINQNKMETAKTPDDRKAAANKASVQYMAIAADDRAKGDFVNSAESEVLSARAEMKAAKEDGTAIPPEDINSLGRAMKDLERVPKDKQDTPECNTAKAHVTLTTADAIDDYMGSKGFSPDKPVEQVKLDKTDTSERRKIASYAGTAKDLRQTGVDFLEKAEKGYAKNDDSVNSKKIADELAAEKKEAEKKSDAYTKLSTLPANPDNKEGGFVPLLLIVGGVAIGGVSWWLANRKTGAQGELSDQLSDAKDVKDADLRVGKLCEAYETGRSKGLTHDQVMKEITDAGIPQNEIDAFRNRYLSAKTSEHLSKGNNPDQVRQELEKDGYTKEQIDETLRVNIVGTYQVHDQTKFPALNGSETVPLSGDVKEREKFFDHYVQINQKAKETEPRSSEAYGCGPTGLIEMAVTDPNDPKGSLVRIIDAIDKNDTSVDKSEINDLREKAKSGKITYGDLRDIQQRLWITLDKYETKQNISSQSPGIHSDAMNKFMDQYNLRHPDRELILIEPETGGAHYIVHDKKEQKIYDPWPRNNGHQYVTDQSELERYLKAKKS